VAPDRAAVRSGPVLEFYASTRAGIVLANLSGRKPGAIGRPLREVFERGDAWVANRDLVRVDEDGDYWLEGSASTLIYR
jgi:putative long chain acyl-CoA synthase